MVRGGMCWFIIASQVMSPSTRLAFAAPAPKTYTTNQTCSAPAAGISESAQYKGLVESYKSSPGFNETCDSFTVWSLSSCKTYPPAGDYFWTPDDDAYLRNYYTGVNKPPTGGAMSFQFLPDGSYTACGNWLTVKRWEVSSQTGGSSSSAGLPSQPPSSSNGKVTICHFPPGNPENVQTITISTNAYQTHVDHHDDYLGECRATVDSSQPPAGGSSGSNSGGGGSGVVCDPFDGSKPIDPEHGLVGKLWYGPQYMGYSCNYPASCTSSSCKSGPSWGPTCTTTECKKAMDAACAAAGCNCAGMRFSSQPAAFPSPQSAPASLFFNQLNVPKRSFDQGFPTQGGGYLSAGGEKLIDYFSFIFETTAMLQDSDSEGQYQFALLSDDGSVLETGPTPGNYNSVLVDNDGQHADQMRCSSGAITMIKKKGIPLRIKYFQGPRFYISVILLWRKISPGMSLSSGCSYPGNGWTPVPAGNLFMPQTVPPAVPIKNPCASPSASPSPSPSPSPSATSAPRPSARPSAAPSPSPSPSVSHKVDVCHIPPGNPANAHTISISDSALSAHLAHGDSLGECPATIPTPVPIPSVAPSVAPSPPAEPSPSPAPSASPEPSPSASPEVSSSPSSSPSVTPSVEPSPTDSQTPLPPGITPSSTPSDRASAGPPGDPSPPVIIPSGKFECEVKKCPVGETWDSSSCSCVGGPGVVGKGIGGIPLACEMTCDNVKLLAAYKMSSSDNDPAKMAGNLMLIPLCKAHEEYNKSLKVQRTLAGLIVLGLAACGATCANVFIAPLEPALETTCAIMAMVVVAISVLLETKSPQATKLVESVNNMFGRVLEKTGEAVSTAPKMRREMEKNLDPTYLFQQAYLIPASSDARELGLSLMKQLVRFLPLEKKAYAQTPVENAGSVMLIGATERQTEVAAVGLLNKKLEERGMIANTGQINSSCANGGPVITCTARNTQYSPGGPPRFPPGMTIVPHESIVEQSILCKYGAYKLTSYIDPSTTTASLGTAAALPCEFYVQQRPYDGKYPPVYNYGPNIPQKIRVVTTNDIAATGANPNCAAAIATGLFPTIMPGSHAMNQEAMNDRCTVVDVSPPGSAIPFVATATSVTGSTTVGGDLMIWPCALIAGGAALLAYRVSRIQKTKKDRAKNCKNVEALQFVTELLYPDMNFSRLADVSGVPDKSKQRDFGASSSVLKPVTTASSLNTQSQVSKSEDFSILSPDLAMKNEGFSKSPEVLEMIEADHDLNKIVSEAQAVDFQKFETTFEKSGFAAALSEASSDLTGYSFDYAKAELNEIFASASQLSELPAQGSKPQTEVNTAANAPVSDAPVVTNNKLVAEQQNQNEASVTVNQKPGFNLQSAKLRLAPLPGQPDFFHVETSDNIFQIVSRRLRDQLSRGRVGVKVLSHE